VESLGVFSMQNDSTIHTIPELTMLYGYLNSIVNSVPLVG